MPEILALMIMNILIGIFGIVAFVLGMRIVAKWDANAATSLQYKLEKQSFLGATLIKYIFWVKLPLFLFFIFTIDKLSNVITGAMCAAGVVDATPYGTYLFLLKIINLYLFGLWLVLHYLDVKEEIPRYTKVKYALFLIVFPLLASEILLEILLFSAIDVSKMVSCCGTLYSVAATSYIANIFRINTFFLLGFFYGNYLLLFVAFWRKNRFVYTILSALFIIVSLISLIAFFGTYIYELPTHHCPFCFLQKDYYYVGYLLYSLLFVGTFYGLIVGIVKEKTQRNLKRSLFFISLYTVLVSMYPAVYFLRNGVWL